MALLDPVALLERMARRRDIAPSEPNLLERALVHLLYAAGLLMPLRAILATKAKPAALTFDGVLTPMISLVVATLALMVWCAVVRPTAPARWYFSHTMWCGVTFGGVAIAVTVMPIIMFGGLLFVALLPPLAIVAVYGPVAIALVAGVWLCYRMVRGYAAFLKNTGIGMTDTDAPAPAAASRQSPPAD